MTTTRPAPMRPAPRPGQLWSAASPKLGRRYVRIVAVVTEGRSYTDAVEVDARGRKVQPTSEHPLRGRTFSISIPYGELPPCYRYEKETA